jgi:AcrR family transcriptional regulator
VVDNLTIFVNLSPVTTGPTAEERLLDATLEVAAVHGISRLSVGDVAKRAGLSRQTLYKHFASRDELVSRTVLREAGRMVELVVAAAALHDDPVASLEAAVLETLHLVRDHPLLDRLIATEPEALLPMLIDGQGAVLGAIRAISEQIIEERVPGATVAEAHSAADLLSRMLISYAVRSPDRPPEEVARFLSTAIVAGLTAAPAPAHRSH